MKRLSQVLAVAAFLPLAALWAGYSQKVVTYTVVGSLFIQNRNGPQPIPASGYAVYIINARTTQSTGPSITDSYGRFTFYRVPAANYILRIYRSGERMFEEVIPVPPDGQTSLVTRVAPIVLPPP
jgi:hypothetical protein